MAVGFIKVGSYHNGKYFGSVKDLKTIQSHLKYIGFRSRERTPGEDVFFNSKTNKADWRTFYSKTERHKALQHRSTVKAHKMIFSLRKNDYERYKLSGRDYKDIVRNVLGEYEKRKGMELDWIAVEHGKNDHPHVHVVIRAVSEPMEGKAKRVFLSKEDIAEMKQDFDLEVERNRGREVEQERSQEQTREADNTLFDLFNELGKSIERQVKRAERERERAVEELEKKNKNERDR